MCVNVSNNCKSLTRGLPALTTTTVYQTWVIIKPATTCDVPGALGRLSWEVKSVTSKVVLCELLGVLCFLFGRSAANVGSQSTCILLKHGIAGCVWCCAGS